MGRASECRRDSVGFRRLAADVAISRHSASTSSSSRPSIGERDTKMAPARAVCAWRSKTRDDGVANAAPHVREYIHLRKVLSAELNVAASKKQSHAMTIRAMRRSVPEGALTRALDEEDVDAAPEEFYAVTFTNPERRAVVARARGVEDVPSGDDNARARVCREASTMTSDAAEVEAFLNAPSTRFHRAAQTYAVAGRLRRRRFQRQDLSRRDEFGAIHRDDSRFNLLRDERRVHGGDGSSRIRRTRHRRGECGGRVGGRRRRLRLRRPSHELSRRRLRRTGG